MLLSNRGVHEEINVQNIIIDPFRRELLQPSSYDVILGPDFKVQLHFDEAPYLDPHADSSEFFTDVHVPKDSALAINPGDFILGHTFETIALGADIAARVEGKSSLGRLGIVVHSTAGFVDPGFEGQITLELSNSGTMPIMLYPGMKIAQLCFFKLEDPTTLLYGSRAAGSHYQYQAGPTTSKSYENFKIYDVYGE